MPSQPRELTRLVRRLKSASRHDVHKERSSDGRFRFRKLCSSFGYIFLCEGIATPRLAARSCEGPSEAILLPVPEFRPLAACICVYVHIYSDTVRNKKQSFCSELFGCGFDAGGKSGTDPETTADRTDPAFLRKLALPATGCFLFCTFGQTMLPVALLGQTRSAESKGLPARAGQPILPAAAN